MGANYANGGRAILYAEAAGVTRYPARLARLLHATGGAGVGSICRTSATPANGARAILYAKAAGVTRIPLDSALALNRRRGRSDVLNAAASANRGGRLAWPTVRTSGFAVLVDVQHRRSVCE